MDLKRLHFKWRWDHGVRTHMSKLSRFSFFSSAHHLFALLLVSGPSCPLGDLLLPFWVNVFQVEMHWSRLATFESVRVSVKHHEGSEILRYLQESNLARYHFTDAGREHKTSSHTHTLTHTLTYCITHIKSVASVSIFALGPQTPIPEWQKGPDDTCTHSGLCYSRETWCWGPSAFWASRKNCSQQQVSLSSLAPLTQAIVNL